MSAFDEGREEVIGERGVAAVSRALSLQARVSHWLAMAVMLLVGCALLVWYYAHEAGRGARTRQAATPARQSIAAEMILPPLGPLEPHPAPPARVADASVAPVLMAVPSSAPAEKPPLLAPTAPPAARSAIPRDRRLSAQVYVAASAFSPSGSLSVVAPAAARAPDTAAVASRPTSTNAGAVASGAVPDAPLSAPSAVPVAAHLLGAQSLILPKGTSIDCTLETAIDSTLPGLTRCLTATDTFGADGHVVLLERGTELVGETQSQVQQGAARVFVLWSEARTPHGVIVPLKSPGADELGRAGLPGTVQRHFWERFGAAILVSTIDGAVQAAVQSSSSRDNGTVIYNPGASQDVMTEVLRSTVAIPPTVRKANGDRIQVLVARDVDFGDVYQLRVSDTSR